MEAYDEAEEANIMDVDLLFAEEALSAHLGHMNMGGLVAGGGGEDDLDWLL